MLLANVDGPVCVVTGSSRGIGKAIALALGSQGARVRLRLQCCQAHHDMQLTTASSVLGNQRSCCNFDLELAVQVVVNYASSSGAAEEVAEQIKAAGGDAVTVQADLGQGKDIQK